MGMYAPLEYGPRPGRLRVADGSAASDATAPPAASVSTIAIEVVRLVLLLVHVAGTAVVAVKRISSIFDPTENDVHEANLPRDVKPVLGV